MKQKLTEMNKEINSSILVGGKFNTHFQWQIEQLEREGQHGKIFKVCLL
jgi:hypothetical protein